MCIIGGGLAGSESAFQLAQRGVHVDLYEMRPKESTPAHKTHLCAELVCSNSFRSSDAEHNAVGVLQRELRACDSLIMRCADKTKLPAGSALAVDRTRFAECVTQTIDSHPNIQRHLARIDSLPEQQPTIVATGPLTAAALAADVQARAQSQALAFFDAIAPLVYRDSLDLSVLWLQSRYDKSSSPSSLGDYLNAPLNREQYLDFVRALKHAQTHDFRDWEKTPYFEACLPIEVAAARGEDTLRFGPMKPVGLTDPKTQRPSWAVVQLRRDDHEGRLWNMVGFQTKMLYSEQKRVLTTLPGFAHAEFARLGGLHRNSFLNSPKILGKTLSFLALPNVKFAGQITGVEGYVESTAIGLLAALFLLAERRGASPLPPPETTAFGALLAHIAGKRGGAGGGKQDYQPMNINFGLFPEMQTPSPSSPSSSSSPAKKVRGRERKALLSQRAEKHFQAWQREAL